MIVAAYPASMWMSLAMDSTWMLDKQNLLGGFGYPLIMCLTCSGSVMCMFITLSRFPIATRNRSNWELLLAHTWLLSHVVPVVIKIVWFDKSFPAFSSSLVIFQINWKRMNLKRNSTVNQGLSGEFLEECWPFTEVASITLHGFGAEIEIELLPDCWC